MKEKAIEILLFAKNIIVAYKSYFIAAIPFFTMDLMMRIFICNIDFYPVYRWAPNLFTLSWVVVFVGVIYALSGIWRTIAYWFFFGLSFIVYMVNAIYYTMTSFCFSFTLLEMSSEGSEYILDTILGTDLWVYMSMLFVLAVGIGIYIFIRKDKGNKPPYGVLGVAGLAFVLHMLAVVCLGTANSDLKWNTFRNPRNVYDDFSDCNKCMRIAGMYEYTIRNFYITFLKSEEAISREDEAFLDKIYEGNQMAEENFYTGLYEGKNLIFLQLEGIDSWLLTEETMPNLYALMENSINFSQHYSMYTGGGSTFNSEFAVNTGFITPVSYIENVYSFHSNTFNYSMARMFKNKGYTVNAFHMNSGEYYSRGINYNSWGYDNYYGLIDVTDYDDDSYKLDRELLQNSTFYKEMFGQGGKFVNYIITYSPHTPFSDEKEVGKMLVDMLYEGREEEKPESFSEEDIARLMAGETDYFIGLLMQALKDNGLYEDTVIVAYADHYLYTLNDKTILDRYKITENNLINHTPFFIWSSDTDRETITEVTMQTNILPTVLNLFGIDYNPNNYIGLDALDSDYNGYVFFSDYSWYDGKAYVENGKVTYGDKADEEYIQLMNEKIGAIVRKNDLTLRYNFFKKRTKTLGDIEKGMS